MESKILIHGIGLYTWNISLVLITLKYQEYLEYLDYPEVPLLPEIPRGPGVYEVSMLSGFKIFSSAKPLLIQNQ